MEQQTPLPSTISSAFVTGATGLLGNNLVRMLAARGVRVVALVRSPEKAAKQLAGLPIELVTGDLTDVRTFAGYMQGVEVLFHAAAFFRESYKGGGHRKNLLDTNVRGTRELLSYAYDAGIRRFVHVSSSLVLNGPEGAPIDESMGRAMEEADDYTVSKILTDREVARFLELHPESGGCCILPGWLIGPGDTGPTSSGQLILDFMLRKLPGVAPATFSIVDARDVAEAMWEAALHGRRGESYLVAGRHTTMADLMALLERISGVPAPKHTMPFAALYALAALNEAWRAISGKPALISMASVRFLESTRNRTRFNSEKAWKEFGVPFRPLEETLRNTVAWYRNNGWLDRAAH